MEIRIATIPFTTSSSTRVNPGATPRRDPPEVLLEVLHLPSM
jgi:hypothetical protein